jgi:hypothetical protein
MSDQSPPDLRTAFLGSGLRRYHHAEPTRGAQYALGSSHACSAPNAKINRRRSQSRCIADHRAGTAFCSGGEVMGMGGNSTAPTLPTRRLEFVLGLPRDCRGLDPLPRRKPGPSGPGLGAFSATWTSGSGSKVDFTSRWRALSPILSTTGKKSFQTFRWMCPR